MQKNYFLLCKVKKKLKSFEEKQTLIKEVLDMMYMVQ